VLPTPRTELHQREAIGIIPPVLLSVVASFATLVTRERDQYSIRSFRHILPPNLSF
jgi:hypothetical protein